MRRIITGILFLFSTSVFSQDIPKPLSPPRLVNDYIHLLSQDEQNSLEQKLRAYNDSTSTQIVVAIVSSIGDNDVNFFAYKILEDWGVGQQGKNNGIVVLVSKDDRKAAISTGYGMEGRITDAITRRIRENYMNPNFRNGNFYQGLDEATTAIMQAASGEYKNDQSQKTPLGGIIVIIIILIFIIIPIISAASRTRKNHFGRKGLDFWTILWLLSNSGGGRRGGGGGWGGGSGGGGGFGGFGGGHGGGGGSGGSW